MLCLITYNGCVGDYMRFFVCVVCAILAGNGGGLGLFSEFCCEMVKELLHNM